MIELTDEILNKYIDGELERDIMQQIWEQLKNSEIDKKRFITLHL